MAGARTNSFPSVDIANGAPSGTAGGAPATNEIVLTWSNGPTSTSPGQPNEQAKIAYSTNRGATFLGDYSYAAAAPGAGFAVWNDVRNAADCPAVDDYRQKLVDGQSASPPDVEGSCPATFGNSDIFGGAFTP